MLGVVAACLLVLLGAPGTPEPDPGKLPRWRLWLLVGTLAAAALLAIAAVALRGR